MNVPELTAAPSYDLVEKTVDVVAAYLASHSVQSHDIPALIESVHRAFSTIQNGPQEVKEREPLQPRMPIRKTVTPDYLISLEDGRQYRALKRHLTRLGMTPEEYRTKWGLPSDYPMVAPSYSEKRSQMAKDFGLGARRRKSRKILGSSRAAAKA